MKEVNESRKKRDNVGVGEEKLVILQKRIISGLLLPRLLISELSSIFLIQTLLNLEKQAEEALLGSDSNETQSRCPWCKDWHNTVRQILLVVKCLPGHARHRRIRRTENNPYVRVRWASHLHAALHARSGSIVQTGAVVIVGGVDIGLLVLASLQPGPGPAQDHLAAWTHKKKKKKNTKRYSSVNFCRKR